jgi:drug/metabolite transporter (DMT)-like permease
VRRGHPGSSVLLALAAAALFGAATPASKALLRELSSFQLAGLLYLGAALGVLPAALRAAGRRRLWPADRRNALRLCGAIGCGGILGPVLLLLGLRLASAASVALWLNFEMVATAVLGRLLFHDHLGRYGWLAVCGTVCAGALLSVSEGAAGLPAALLVAAACMCWGLDNHLTALIDGILPSQSTLWKGLVAGSVNLLIGAAARSHGASLAAVGVALVVGALSYGASIALYITAAQGIGATRAQMLFASAPFFGAALAVGTLGEPISGGQTLAAAVFVVSVALLFRDQHAHAHAHEAMAHAHIHAHDDGHHAHGHPDEPVPGQHAHWHEHERLAHAHPHWPDLHHRHAHQEAE